MGLVGAGAGLVALGIVQSLALVFPRGRRAEPAAPPPVRLPTTRLRHLEPEASGAFRL